MLAAFRLAEARLESARGNLTRVFDILEEVGRQLNSLKRQAAKARRYSEIREQMRGIVRQMLAGKARELDGEADRIAKHLEEMTAAEAHNARTIQQQEIEQDSLKSMKSTKSIIFDLESLHATCSTRHIDRQS